MSATGRLIGGPCNGQTVILGETVEYVTPGTDDDPDEAAMYVYDRTDPGTGEHLFRWTGK